MRMRIGGGVDALRFFSATSLRARSGGSVRQAMLLAALAAALAGLFLLLEFVVSLASSGPRDPLAVTSSPETTLGVPNGAGLLELLALAASVVLAAATLVAALGWPLRRASARRPWRLVLGVSAAAGVVSAGAYVASSGILGGSIPYGEHMVQRADLDAGSLMLIAAFFLSVTIAGLLNWRMLATSLLVWLVAFAAFGFLDSKSVGGLLLFPRTDLQGVPGDFGAAVRGIQQPDAATAGQSTDSDQPLLAEVTALRQIPPVDEPVFRVAGAAHTRYLRTSTGDSYRDGAWRQLERASVTLAPNEPVADALGPLAEQPHLPTAPTLHEVAEQISVMPVEGAESLPAGVLPAPANLRSVAAPATYFPFSETLASEHDLPGYELESAVSLFALNQKVDAAAVADPAYLQLPEALAPRVHELADQVAGETSSPYLAARLIQVHLQEGYAYRPGGSAAQARPPAGQDPVDWFLFDRGAGTSGNFSSAFVVLARAAGVPARAVSGWVVATQQETQTVHRRQAHQWAEIALDGIGWVTVDPFPRDAFIDGDVDHAWATALGELAASASQRVRDTVPALRNAADHSDALVQLFDAIAAAPQEAVRQAAQAALGALTLDRFTGMLLDHEDAQVRQAAAYGLEVIADREALGALADALANDEDARVRVSAADALGVVGKGAAEEPLLAVLAADESAAVRAAAATALGALRTASTASRMLPALRSDPSPEARAAVALALGRIGDNATLLPLLDARAGDASPEVRAAAAAALAEWEFADLLQMLDSAATAALRAAAAQLMGEGGFAEAIAPLGEALSDAAPQVRAAARAAMEEIGEVVWLESGGGVLLYQGDLAFLPFVTSENDDVAASPGPVFRVRGSAHTSLLRVAVGDIYQDGEWFPGEQEALSAGVAGIGFRPHDIRPRQPDDAGDLDSIFLSGIGFDQVILDGATPTSLHAQAFSVPVSYRVPGHTVFARGPARYGWDAVVYEYSPELLDAAETWPVADSSAHLQLPRGAWVEQARELATAITAGQTTPYGKAKAIERHLIEEYRYIPVEPPADAAAPGQDPVATFLFDSRQGTAGPFSSAFVILARSVGIPARVVSGWAVADRAASQVVFSDQAHQWAEVPFDGLGWVTFDAAPDGAPSRVPASVRDAYERLGAEVTPLETGGALVDLDDETFMIAGTTARQSEAPPVRPLFEVEGAAHTGYLRMAVGERYEDGAWSELDPGAIRYTAGGDIPGATREYYDSLRDGSDTAFADRLASLSLLGFRHDPARVATDRIRVRHVERTEALPSGAMPTSLDLQRKDLDGVFHPFSATFSTEIAATDYAWTSEVAFFSEEQYDAAPAAPAAAYTRLPDDLPDDIAGLARQVTARHGTAHAKAVALERYLSANYEYAFAEGALDGAVPAGRDPVEWFLFDSRRGTAGQFSSAFVVLARSVGIPARVVAGFVVTPTAERQVADADQAHQWAEVALEGIGWVRFDPVAAGGAPTRVPGASPQARAVESSDPGGGDASAPTDTITDITESPEKIRRLTPFVVAGTVRAADGGDVTGMTVEIYINETKEHGGTKIGVTTSRSGSFRAHAQLPPAMDLGDYQILARAVGNSLFNESWSDPDVQVFSGNKIELSGPATVDRNAEAVFNGRVTDDSERGVVGRLIEVRFDGTAARPVLSDAEGRFGFSRAFSELGQHSVEVQLEGEELLLDNTARLAFEVMLPTEIAVYAPASVALGEALTATGVLREADGPSLTQGQVELTIEGPAGAETATVDVGQHGKFEHATQSFERSGRYTLTARYGGAEFVRPAAAEVAFAVLRPTVLTLDGPAAARDGERFMIEGTLREADGRPVANAAVRVPGAEPPSPVTGAEGRFATEVRATFDERTADGPDDPHESTLRVTAVFDDTAELAASDAAVSIAVGVPWILVEPLQPVTRGSAATLRGAVMLGATRPVAGVELTAGPGAAFRSNDAGAFTFTYPVPAGAPLGAAEIVIDAAALDATATVPLVIQSAATLVVTPVGKVRPGETAKLQVALLDDTGTPIAGGAVQSSGGSDAVTDGSGVAVLELAVPPADALAGSRAEFSYAGDDLHAAEAVTYFWEGAITPDGVNWLLWAGVPGLIALLAAAGYAGRRFTVVPLLRRLRRNRAPADPAPAPAEADEVESGDPDADAYDDDADADGDAPGEDDAVADPQPIEVRIAAGKPADDLADVWGIGEEIPITVSVADDGQAVAGASVAVSVDGGPPSELTVGDDGAGTFGWSSAEPGEHTVSAEFAGDGGLVVSETRSVRVVEFREEIVRLYGIFSEWAMQQGAGVSEVSTPREAGILLASHGRPISRRDLDEVIFRFEEADYSEHEISRRHYEAMYRALNAVVASDP